MRFGEFRKEIKKFFKKNSKRKNFVFRFLPNIKRKIERIKAMERRKRFVVLGISVLFLFAAGFAVAGVIGGFSTGDINKGLVGHWPLDSAHLNSTTNRVDDISGHGNHGTNSGASLTTDRHGQSNGAMSFGGGNYINCGNNENLNLGDVEGSWGGWIYIPSDISSNKIIWNKGPITATNPTGSYFNYCFANGDIGFYVITTNGSTNIRTALYANTNLGTWHHIFNVFKNQHLYAYIDGDEVTSGATTYPTIRTNTNHLMIGGDSPHFYGSIQDVRIYNRALSSGEVKKLYEIYKPKFSVGSANKGLVGHWPLRPEGEKVGIETVTDGDMENDPVNNWNAYRANLTLTKYSGDKHFGSYSLKAEASSVAATNYSTQSGVVVIPGKRYSLSGWMKSDSSASEDKVQFAIYDESNSSWIYERTIDNYESHVDWNKFQYNFVAPSGCSYIRVYVCVYNNTGIGYFDDISVKPLETADSTPNSNHGEIYGAEIRNHGGSFNGSSDFVGNIDLGDTTTTELTQIYWIKKDALSDVHRLTSTSPFDAGFSTSAFFVHTHSSSGTDNNIPYGSLGITVGKWHMIAITKETSSINQVKVYLDGELELTGNLINAANGIMTLSGFSIGNSSASWDGQISDVLIYDRALSADEVLELYQGADVAGAILDMPLSDKTGFKDISGNDYHGTNYGVDIVGEAGGFDGVDDYVQNDNITSSLNNFTVSAWIKHNNITGILSMDHYMFVNGVQFRLRPTGKLNLRYSGDYQSNSILESDTWYFVNYTSNGSQVKIYVNGILDKVLTLAISPNGSTITIGDYLDGGDGSNNWDGLVSDVKIYNRALSDGGVSVGQDAKGEIGASYAKGRSGSAVGTSTTNLNKGLVGQWDLKSKNEKVGSDLATDGSFDDWTGNVLDNWNEYNGVVLTEVVGVVGNCPQLANDGGSAQPVIQQSSVTTVVGKTYRITYWVKAGTEATSRIRTHDGSSYIFNETQEVLTTWTKYTRDFVATTVTTSIYFGLDSVAGDGKTIFYDEVSFKEIQTADSTPYGNHGMIYGATVGDDYLQITEDSYISQARVIHNDNINFDQDTDFSLSVWVKDFSTTGGSSTLRSIFSKGSYGGGFGIGYRTDLDSFGAGVRTTDNNYNYHLISDPGDGLWHNLVMVYIAEGKNLYTYLDGGESSGHIVLGGNQTFGNTEYLSIGNGRPLYGSNDTYEGKISDGRIYNRALSEAEVKLLYDKGR